MNLNIKKLSLLSLLAVSTSLQIACKSEDAATTTTTPATDTPTTTEASLADDLNSAVVYMDESLPNVGSASAMSIRNNASPRLSIMSAYGLSSVWDSSVSAEQVGLPGGTGSGCTEPDYNGAALPSSVSVKDYIGMSLDSNFERCSDGGASPYYKPTIFGRLATATQIIGYLNSFMPVDEFGVFDNGDGNATISVDGVGIDVYYTVADAAVTTYYDKSVAIRGYMTGTSQEVFNNLMWIRNNEEVLNFMFMESGDFFNGASNGSDGVKDNVTINILSYNKVTGQMAFEYTSDTATSVPDAAANPSVADVEVFRLFIAEAGGESQILSYKGRSDSSPSRFTMFSVFSPTGETSDEASVSFNYLGQSGDTVSGNTCVTVADASASGSAACTGHTNASDISSSLGSAVNAILAFTDTTDLLEAKGFQASTAASLDWSDDTVKSNFLTDGASVSVGFSSIADMLTETDGTP